MQLLTLASIAALAALPNLALSASFNVSPPGTSCGHGTTISCSPAPGGSCKGNFDPAQNSIVVTVAQGNCHVSLYPDANQAGGVVERLNTDTTGSCVTVSAPTWKSWGLYCT